MKRDIFYDINSKSFEEKLKIMNNAKELCYKWEVDKLDCMESWARQHVDMSWNDIIDKASEDSYFVFIHRYNTVSDEDEYLEVGFRSMGPEIDYFLWIYIDVEYEDKLTDKWNLEVLND